MSTHGIHSQTAQPYFAGILRLLLSDAVLAIQLLALIVIMGTYRERLFSFPALVGPAEAIFVLTGVTLTLTVLTTLLAILRVPLPSELTGVALYIALRFNLVTHSVILLGQLIGWLISGLTRRWHTHHIPPSGSAQRDRP